MRIIYKIKSSWDFISSQILIYLKRRWNSKMAISIKNHEDRITALEKYKVGKNSVYNCECVGHWSNDSKNPFTLIKTEQTSSFLTLNKDNGEITLNPGAYLIFCQYSFSIPKVTVNNGVITNIELYQNGKLIYKPRRSWCATFNTVNAFLYYVIDVPTVNKIQIKSYATGIYVDVIRNDGFSLFVLKLYYNFSYNITREFYKVKFKLKHYLCSHLQKFI